MAVRRLWKPFAAAALFILVMFYVMHVKHTREGFISIADLIKKLSMAQNQYTVVNSYDQWVGYIYKYPEVSAKALNDFYMILFTVICITIGLLSLTTSLEVKSVWIQQPAP